LLEFFWPVTNCSTNANHASAKVLSLVGAACNGGGIFVGSGEEMGAEICALAGATTTG